MLNFNSFYKMLLVKRQLWHNKQEWDLINTTLMRFDNAHAAVLAVEPLFDSIKRARGHKAPWASNVLLSSAPSPATLPMAHAHCSATSVELFSNRHREIKTFIGGQPSSHSWELCILETNGNGNGRYYIWPTNKRKLTTKVSNEQW